MCRCADMQMDEIMSELIKLLDFFRIEGIMCKCADVQICRYADG